MDTLLTKKNAVILNNPVSKFLELAMFYKLFRSLMKTEEDAPCIHNLISTKQRKKLKESNKKRFKQRMREMTH